MEDNETVLFGVPVPSDNKVFLTFIVAHIILGLICVLGGLLAILTNKTSKIHKYAGNVYFWGYTVLFITIIITSIMRWPHNIHLLAVGSFGYSLAFVGRRMAR
jgi:ABC-type sugar transport system permease subunit